MQFVDFLGFSSVMLCFVIGCGSPSPLSEQDIGGNTVHNSPNTTQEESPIDDTSEFTRERESGSAGTNESNAIGEPPKESATISEIDELTQMFLPHFQFASIEIPNADLGLKMADSLERHRADIEGVRGDDRPPLSIVGEFCVQLLTLSEKWGPIEYGLTTDEFTIEAIQEKIGAPEQEEAGELVRMAKSGIGTSSTPINWHRYGYLEIGFEGKRARACRIFMAPFLEAHPEFKK